jgi:hypothetical protein
VAGVVAGNDWSMSLAFDEATGDPSHAAILARGWLDDALAEHASIASFARFTLELLALGAPSDMVLAAQRAGLDEVRHARTCFALASRYAGKPAQPGALETESALRAADLVDFAYRTVLEGCVGETIAALIVAEQARSATQPALRRALERIARDEERHAELAWQAVRWALDRGGVPVHAAVARAFYDALRPAALPGLQAEPDLRRHGRLRLADVAEVRARGLREIIGPCAQALLATTVKSATGTTARTTR